MIYPWQKNIFSKNQWFILIYARPGNCKSLEQAKQTYRLFIEYHETEKNYPQLPHRFAFTNQKLEALLQNKEKSHDHLYYWENIKDLRYCPRPLGTCYAGPLIHDLHDCDILVDEGGYLFPADGWKDSPDWLRKLWSQHRHRGIRILMLTQDYKQIDINVRRMLWDAYAMRKMFGSRDISPTLPPLYPWSIRNLLDIRRSVIWGVYYKQKIDPALLESESDTTIKLQLNETLEADYQSIKLVGFKKYSFISHWKTTLYDTRQDVKKPNLIRELKHTIAICDHKDHQGRPCGERKVIHSLI